MRLIYGAGICDIKGVSCTRDYSIWLAMVRRCCSESYQKENPAYKGCKLAKEFLFFSEFKAWYQNQIGYEQGFDIDKDLLADNVKEYHPKKCVLIPNEINKALIKNNSKNKKLPTGVSKGKSGLFESRIVINKKLNVIGGFETIDDAFQAYKQAKEAHIKVLANKYKDQIDPRAYEALMNYRVEITD